MGSNAGHTYFARVAASANFPSRTKVYITRQEAFSEYAEFLFSDDKVHEPIELLDETSGYTGNPVEFVLIDMNGESARRFRHKLGSILSTIPPTTRILLLQADFSIF